MFIIFSLGQNVRMSEEFINFAWMMTRLALDLFCSVIYFLFVLLEHGGHSVQCTGAGWAGWLAANLYLI